MQLPRTRGAIRRFAIAISSALLVPASLAAAQPALRHATDADASPGSSLQIRVAHVRNGRGRVHADVCTADQFLKDCAYSADAPASPGVTTVTVKNLPPGVYAAQVYHDENGSGRVERNLLGLPKEGVGFSRIMHVLLRAPKFPEASFRHEGGTTTVSASLHYYVG